MAKSSRDQIEQDEKNLLFELAKNSKKKKHRYNCETLWILKTENMEND